MLTDKQFQDIKKNGTKNTVYFCGKEFVETTTKEIIEFLNDNKL